ncbi:hypothetical protein [uncultured Campylobacter sp.]|uniref:hypothetical protein n=1 Tax=uncultured Campylobacter sp. TaxID=218934 RepID=UPI00261E567E|nr:hypothetical protein [uncultured Campylobacter sp.]
MTIYPCCYLSAGAVSACRFDPDRLTLGADICARIDRYCAKRRRIASAQNMKAHYYKRASGARASLRFINISREWACVLHVCKACAKFALR